MSFRRKTTVADTGGDSRIMVILFALSCLFFFFVKGVPSRKMENLEKEMISASKIMLGAQEVLRECRRKKGIPIDKKEDPNETGLIGLKHSPLTTSLGQLEAKRTTTNPNFAALVVFLLHQAGVKRQDKIAVAASGSFPALILAVLSASRAMGVEPMVIPSLGASQWGANHPDFHWLRMHECLNRAGVFPWMPVALSLGGTEDMGEDMEEAVRQSLIEEIRASRLFLIQEPDLERNVRLRMELFEEKAGEDGIKAFVNIGGSWPCMGSDPDVLKLKPGFVRIGLIPPPGRRGLIHEMASRRVPVVHLLFIRGLVRRYGLCWDPMPLPQPGEGRLYILAWKSQPLFLYAASVYLILGAVVFVLRGFRPDWRRGVWKDSSR